MSARLKARRKKLLALERARWSGNAGARFPVALVHPHIYPVAMGNLGFQVIYHLLNREPDLVCERAFLPDPLGWEEHVRTRTPVLALESQRPLTDFGAVAFSVSFEPDYVNVLKILAASHIPLKASDRGPGDPLVVAGGVALFLNPEPLAPFVDAFFLGEGEVGGAAFFRFLAQGAASPDRAGMLQELAEQTHALLERPVIMVLFNGTNGGQIAHPV